MTEPFSTTYWRILVLKLLLLIVGILVSGYNKADFEATKSEAEKWNIENTPSSD